MYASLCTDDTIAAVASPAGGALRGIVRVSGGDCLSILGRCCVGIMPEIQTARSAEMVDTVFRTELGDIPCRVLIWPTDRSYTRQPCAEIHTIGSAPLLEVMLARICAAGARTAEPGEFTLRAFLAGRLDLLQAEAVLGVIQARGERELSTALAQLAGGLSKPLQELRSELLDSLVQLEAGLDFAEEGIDFVSRDVLREQLERSLRLVAGILRRIAERGTSSSECQVALMGFPNVGKSSLFNALSGSAKSIVSPSAGATRDYVTARIELQGHCFNLVDTAGIGQPTNANHRPMVAAEEMSIQQHDASVARILCLDASREANGWEQEVLANADTRSTILAWTKIDLRPAHMLLPQFEPGLRVVATSCHNGRGIQELLAAIRELLCEQLGLSDSSAINSRCQSSLILCQESLQSAHIALAQNLGDELIAADLRTALEELGRIVGAVYTDEILDQIFSQFCIGK